MTLRLVLKNDLVLSEEQYLRFKLGTNLLNRMPLSVRHGFLWLHFLRMYSLFEKSRMPDIRLQYKMDFFFLWKPELDLLGSSIMYCSDICVLRNVKDGKYCCKWEMTLSPWIKSLVVCCALQGWPVLWACFSDAQCCLFFSTAEQTRTGPRRVWCYNSSYLSQEYPHLLLWPIKVSC